MHALGEGKCSGTLEEFSKGGIFVIVICMVGGKTAGLIAR